MATLLNIPWHIDIMLGSWQDKKRTCFWTTANGTRYRVDDCIVEYSDRHMLVSSKLQPVRPHNYSIQRKTRLAQLDGHRVHILASFQVEPTDLGLFSSKQAWCIFVRFSSLNYLFCDSCYYKRCTTARTSLLRPSL